MALGQVIRAARKAQGLRLRQVAEALEVSTAAVSQWELDTAEPSPKNRLALAELLGIDPGVMLGLRIDERDSVANSSALRTNTNLGGAVRRLEGGGEHTLTAPLPIFATRLVDGNMQLATDATDEEIRPGFAVKVRNAYGVLLCSSDMIPAYEPGDRLLIYPERPVYPGRDALFLTPNRQAKVRRLLEISDTHWHVQQWNPLRKERLARSEWVDALWIESVRRR